MKLPKRFVVNISARDIAGGKRDCCRKCPVALAINRSLGINTAVVASNYWLSNWESRIFKLPSVAEEWINQFDAGRDCNPFRFTCST